MGGRGFSIKEHPESTGGGGGGDGVVLVSLESLASKQKYKNIVKVVLDASR